MAVVVEHHRSTIEDEFVLTTHLIHVDDRARTRTGAFGEHSFAVENLAAVVWRTVDVDVDLRATLGLIGHRSVGAPDVLTDRDRHFHSGDLEELMRNSAGDECALFVEHVVVGQHALVVHAAHLTTGAHCGRVVNDRSTRCRIDADAVVDETDHGNARAGHPREIVEYRTVVAYETRFQDEVLGWVASESEFTEGHDVAAGRFGLLVRIGDEAPVTSQITHGRVDLSQADPQRRHDSAG